MSYLYYAVIALIERLKEQIVALLTLCYNPCSTSRLCRGCMGDELEECSCQRQQMLDIFMQAFYFWPDSFLRLSRRPCLTCLPQIKRPRTNCRRMSLLRRLSAL